MTRRSAKRALVTAIALRRAARHRPKDLPALERARVKAMRRLARWFRRRLPRLPGKRRDS